MENAPIPVDEFGTGTTFETSKEANSRGRKKTSTPKMQRKSKQSHSAGPATPTQKVGKRQLAQTSRSPSAKKRQFKGGLLKLSLQYFELMHISFHFLGIKKNVVFQSDINPGL